MSEENNAATKENSQEPFERKGFVAVEWGGTIY